MVTDARGHEIPAGSDPWGYREDMGLLSDSISDVRSVADQDAGDALVAALDANGLDPVGTTCWFRTAGVLAVYNGTTWVKVAGRSDLPVAGLATVKVGGSVPDASVVVTLPAGRFSKAPMLTGAVNTSVPGARGVGFTGASKSSFNCWIHSSSSTNTDITAWWHAIAAYEDEAFAAFAASAEARSLAPAVAAGSDVDVDVIVLCPTDGCSNQGVPIEIPANVQDEAGNTHPVDAVQCGVCGTDITDTMQPIEGS